MEAAGNMEKTGNERKEDTFTYNEAVELAGNGRYNYILLFTSGVIVSASVLDLFGHATVVAAASCDLELDWTLLGIVAAAPYAGVLFAFPWGYYADARGRWRAMLLSTSVSFVFAVASSFSTHWIFMLVMKIIGSSFSVASFTLTITMLGECTDSEHRSQYLFIVNSFNLVTDFFSFALAWIILPLNINIVLPWLDITFRSWRLYTIAQAIPLGVGACLMFFLYESPKYLASRGDYTKALEVLKKIYERNGGNRDEYPVKHLTKLSSDMESSSKGHSFWSSFKQQTLPIFQLPLLWRTIQLFFLVTLCCVTNNIFLMWYPTVVNFFFDSFNDVSNSDKTFCQRVFGVTNMSLDIQTDKCNEEISRYTLYSGMLYGLFYGCCSLCMVKLATRPRLLLILILFISGISFLFVNIKQPVANMMFFTLLQCTSLGLGCLSTYFSELYPTSYRGLVTSLSIMVARLFSFIGVSVIGSIITEYCEATFYMWSGFVFSGILVCLFLPPDRKIMK